MYTIKEVSEMFHIPTTTLRYYDKEGLLPYVERKESGYRSFSETDIQMLRVIECLKKSGMSIKEIRQFADWVQMGDASIKERLEMFRNRKHAVEQQMEELKKTLELIEYKCCYYETALAAGTEDIHKEANGADGRSKECQQLLDSCC
ncbi:MAG: MerR family transcriptional regulator [Lachnospiraceae bacterium]|nr:MerR family transcriptional regulator [Lachnospiraceae bacterium]